MAPQITVIIPNYNHAPYLEQRIESVLNQTLQDFEIIILDDCSTDNSKDIIERYSNHPKVRLVLYNELNSGSTFKQWDKGIEQAAGRWIWVAESDDWCEPTFLEEVLPDPTDPGSQDIVLSYCGSVMYRNNDILHYPSIKYMVQVLDGGSYVRANMTEGNAIYNASSCIFRREAYLRCPSNEQYVFSGDWFIWINIALQGSVKVSGKCLNYFRKHSGDVSGRSRVNGTSHLEYLIIQKYLLDKELINRNEFEGNLFNKYVALKYQLSKEKYPTVYEAYNQAIGLALAKRSKYEITRISKRILGLLLKPFR
jgi:glycosyltransferase involved in cell wall biosynthesis